MENCSWKGIIRWICPQRCAPKRCRASFSQRGCAAIKMYEEIMAKSSSKKNISIVDRGLTIEGSVSCNGQLIVKGAVKGTLEGDHVVIAEDGVVHADATVSVITIGGLFDGTLRVTQKLVILATGLCQGKIVCNDLTVEPGGILNGEVECS